MWEPPENYYEQTEGDIMHIWGKQYGWSVIQRDSGDLNGSYVSLEVAKEKAKDLCRNTGKEVLIYCLVGRVLPPEPTPVEPIVYDLTAETNEDLPI